MVGLGGGGQCDFSSAQVILVLTLGLWSLGFRTGTYMEMRNPNYAELDNIYVGMTEARAEDGKGYTINY